MAGALLSFSATGVAVRALSGTLSVFEILSLRSAAGITFLVILGVARPSLRASVTTRRLGLHAIRNVIHYLGQYGWAYGITLLPLATVFVLEFTMPIWVALLAVLFLGERLTASRVTSIALGFLGVLVILRPGVDTINPATLVVLGAAFAFAISIIATKKLTATDSTFAILFWMNLIQLPLNLLGSSWGFWNRLDASHILPVLGICVSGLSSHYFLTNAYRHGDATVVVPLDFLRIPLIAVVGWQLYGERLDPIVFAGAGLIIAGILWNLRAEARAK
jgi:drug/metabolite transporter (DMT)-like permease